jgi:hypothetical protein
MNHIHHISQDEIFPFVRKDAARKDHLKNCEKCSELVNILQHARKISKNLKPEPKVSHLSTLQISETITRIYDDSISSQEAANFLNHIESCSICFNFVAMTVEESLSPVPEEVLEEIKAYSDISLAKLALQAPPKPKPSVLSQFLKTVHGKFKKSFKKEKSEGTFPIPKLAFLILLLIMVGGGSGGYRYYVTTHKINSAADLLTDNHRIYHADTPRLSGGYASKGIDELMNPAKMPSYLNQAFSLTKKAIASGSKSPKARLLQAQIFIIHKDYYKADSVLTLIEKQDKHLASVLNDFGVLKYKKEEWHAASVYFEAAIQANSNLTEAYYNLALAQNKLGKKQEAISTLNEYLTFKNDVGWKNAALDFVQKLQNREE